MLQQEVGSMFAPFFALAARSPTRQVSFRRAVILHLVVLGGGIWAAYRQPQRQGNELLGHLLLVAGILEGAGLLGWRLTQIPRSQALEFLLVSPRRPRGLFVAEAAVGLALLALVTLAGLPVLCLLAADGRIDLLDVVPLTALPFTWGAVTGLGLTVWAYETAAVRRWGERVVLGTVVLYLIVGVLAGENLRRWVDILPQDVAVAILRGFRTLHTHNPFGVLRCWMTDGVGMALEAAVWIEAVGLAAAAACLLRAATRLQAHFQEWHYQPAADVRGTCRPAVGERPLAWWAVKRVGRYSGRINLWLAGGFASAYAIYLAAGTHWPAWLGKRVFEVCDDLGGVAGLAAGLAVLAAVPAAFQYGLWDSSAQDRCRRLELLLLTRLEPRDYWEAAAAAAWRRGRGYLAVAVLLWAAAVVGGRMGLAQALGALAAAVLLWALYFAVGFRAFARGRQANGLGLLLTVGLPLAAFSLTRLGMPALGAVLPPGMVHAAHRGASLAWLVGPVAAAGLTLTAARYSLRHADAELRRWYDCHHGQKVAG
jgi:hypothetical protein